jgi:hypothetical protein
MFLSVFKLEGCSRGGVCMYRFLKLSVRGVYILLCCSLCERYVRQGVLF